VVASILATGYSLSAKTSQIYERTFTGALDFSGNLYRAFGAWVMTTIITGRRMVIQVPMLRYYLTELYDEGVITRIFAGALDFSSTLGRQINTIWESSLLNTGQVYKTIQTYLAGATDFTGDLLRAFPYIFSGSLDFNGAVQKQVNKLITSATDMTGAITSTIVKNVSGSISTTGNILKQINKLNQIHVLTTCQLTWYIHLDRLITDPSSIFLTLVTIGFPGFCGAKNGNYIHRDNMTTELCVLCD
jgi:hypothetical protein